MCEPTLIASAALTGGSMLAENQRQKRIAAAEEALVSAAVDEETRRQQAFDENIFDLAAESQADFTRQSVDTDSLQNALKIEQRLNDVAAANTLEGGSGDDSITTGPGAGSKVVGDETARQLARVDTARRRDNKNFGKLNAFNQTVFDKTADRNLNNQLIGQQGIFSQQSAALEPGEIQAALAKAQSAGSGLGTLSTALQLAGLATAVAGPEAFAGLFSSAPTAPVSLLPAGGVGTGANILGAGKVASAPLTTSSRVFSSFPVSKVQAPLLF